MATSASKPRGVRSKTKPPLTNAKLLKLARKRKPPQAWYEQTIDPFEAKR